MRPGSASRSAAAVAAKDAWRRAEGREGTRVAVTLLSIDARKRRKRTRRRNIVRGKFDHGDPAKSKLYLQYRGSVRLVFLKLLRISKDLPRRRSVARLHSNDSMDVFCS